MRFPRLRFLRRDKQIRRFRIETTVLISRKCLNQALGIRHFGDQWWVEKSPKEYDLVRLSVQVFVKSVGRLGMLTWLFKFSERSANGEIYETHIRGFGPN